MVWVINWKSNAYNRLNYHDISKKLNWTLGQAADKFDGISDGVFRRLQTLKQNTAKQIASVTVFFDA